MAGDTANVWEDIELRKFPDPFYKACHIFYINKKATSKNILKPKELFKWFLMKTT